MARLLQPAASATCEVVSSSLLIISRMNTSVELLGAMVRCTSGCANQEIRVRHDTRKNKVHQDGYKDVAPDQERWSTSCKSLASDNKKASPNSATPGNEEHMACFKISFGRLDTERLLYSKRICPPHCLVDILSSPLLCLSDDNRVLSMTQKGGDVN